MRSRFAYYSLFITNILLMVGIGVQAYYLIRPQAGAGVFIVRPINYDPSPKFSALAHGCGGPDDAWGTAHLSRDKIKVSIDGATYASSVLAKKELGKRLKDMSRIIERGAKYDDQGQLIGERVVAILAGPDGETATVLWTDRKSLLQIQSVSLEKALELEKYKSR